jgi:hypothetical protein
MAAGLLAPPVLLGSCLRGVRPAAGVPMRRAGAAAPSWEPASRALGAARASRPPRSDRHAGPRHTSQALPRQLIIRRAFPHVSCCGAGRRCCRPRHDREAAGRAQPARWNVCDESLQLWQLGVRHGRVARGSAVDVRDTRLSRPPEIMYVRGSRRRFSNEMNNRGKLRPIGCRACSYSTGRPRAARGSSERPGMVS